MAQRIVGLDIGTSAVRAVELAVVDGAKPILEAFGQVGLPHGAVVDGEVRDRSAVAQALRRLWQEGEFREKRVHLGIAGLRAITRELDMPTLPPDELDDAVRFRADEVVPFPMERTAISSKVIARYTDAEGTPTLRVLIAAAHLDLIDSVVGAVEEAGLEPVGIDLDTAALVRVLSGSTDEDDGPEAIVSVGAGLTLVVVQQGGVLQFVRTIDLGGDSTTRAISSALDLPEADAEVLKRKLGGAGDHDPRAKSAVAQAVSDLVSEIHNSVRFFSAQPGRSPVTRLLVTGGGALTDGFLRELQRGSSVPVISASPLSMTDTSRLPITPEQAAAIDPTLAVPVGLALPDSSGRPFNLLPSEVTQRASERKVRRGLLVGAGAVLVLIIGLSAWRVAAVNSAKGQVATLTSNISEIKTVQIPKYDKAVALKASVETLQKQPVPVLTNEVDWLVVLNQLGQYLPTNAVFTSLTMTATPVASTSTASSTSSSSSSAGASTPAVPTASQLMGTISTTITVPNLASVTAWGQSISGAPILTNVIPTGTLAPLISGVTFTASMNINGNAHSQRLSQFEQELP
jgi:type IV pilus assembly protein PilM